MTQALDFTVEGQGLRLYNPISTSDVSIEIDFVTEIVRGDSHAYIWDGRVGASNGSFMVNNTDKLQFDAISIGSFEIDGVVQSWTSNVTNFVGSGFDSIAGKTLKINLITSTTNSTSGHQVMSKAAPQNTAFGEISAVRILVSDVVVANYDLEEGTGSVLADTTGTYADGAIIGYVDDSIWGVIGGPDTAPDAFTFTDQIDVDLSTVTTSNVITVTGIDAASAISITGGEFSINAGTYTAVSTTVSVNDTVQVRQTSSGSNSTLTDAVLTIGGVSDTFSVTTLTGATATITTGEFKNNTGALQTGLTGLRAVLINPVTGATVLNVTGQTTHATTATLSLTDAALTAAVTYGVITLNNAGTQIGAELVVAV